MIRNNQALARRRALRQIERRRDRQGPNRHDGSTVGDEGWEKLDGTVRIAFQNINGFNFDNEQVKYKRVYNFMAKFEIDAMGIAESNTYWPQLNSKARLWDKTKGWFEGIHLNTGFNKTEKKISKRYQPGGVACITTNKLAYKVVEKGEDATLLGRWAWTRYQGKNNRMLRVATVYRPCKNGGSSSAYVQQLRWLAKENLDREPREALMEDLKVDIEKWREKGDSIIIMGDFNEDIRSQGLVDWRESINLREVLLDG